MSLLCGPRCSSCSANRLSLPPLARQRAPGWSSAKVADNTGAADISQVIAGVDWVVEHADILVYVALLRTRVAHHLGEAGV